MPSLLKQSKKVKIELTKTDSPVTEVSEALSDAMLGDLSTPAKIPNIT